MDLARLISAVVRQTTVLVARLSTIGGERSPLAHVADEVFLGLVSELERQGVGKKVAADMFGLALRSYQMKVQRLQESASETGSTLWSAVRAHIERSGSIRRSDILKRFERDDAASVRGILNDLVETGLVYRTGAGESSMYRATPREDLARLAATDSPEAQQALVFVVVCRDGPLSLPAVVTATGLTPTAARSALDQLMESGRVQKTDQEGDEAFTAHRCLIPLGDEAGWEAAIIDHHQAVLNAIAAKIESGLRTSSPSHDTGGSTYSFELWPGHPDEQELRGLFLRARAEAARLWDRVTQTNGKTARPARGLYRLTFYLGQSVRPEEDEDEAER